jgi:type IV pilus assembly protein PilQ
MNVVFTTELPTGQGQQGQFQPSVPGGRLPGDTSPGQPGASQSSVPGVAINEGPRISLDIENESIQDVFNYVLRVGGLQANRQGRTIFVGIKLPVESQNLVIRTFRLNQANAGAASSVLATYGADTRQSFQRETLASVGQDNAAQLVRILEPPEIITVTVKPEQAGNSPLVLKGLAVTIDERMNSLTLVGDPQRVEIATNILTQLDARRRQVIVNVKIIDVDLLSLNQTSSSFSFGINDTFFTFDQGAAVINFGLFRPPTDRDAATSITRRPNVFLPEEDPRTDQGIGTNFFRFPTQFLARLQAQVQTGNAKILTDPTLVVQEGQTARVQLTQDVVTNIAREVQSERERESTESTQILTERRNESGPPFEFAIGEAGLTLSVEVQRVDDNGFVSMNVIPIVSSISGTQVVSLNRDRNTLYLLNRRALNSGLIRLRDGQTLVLSGIIQDSDRATVRKVPILGDIPILGALFRRTEKDHQRKEVIVLLTPQIMDDSDRATWGYGYTPGPEVQKMLRQNQNPNPNQR